MKKLFLLLLVLFACGSDDSDSAGEEQGAECSLRPGSYVIHKDLLDTNCPGQEQADFQDEYFTVLPHGEIAAETTPMYCTDSPALTYGCFSSFTRSCTWLYPDEISVRGDYLFQMDFEKGDGIISIQMLARSPVDVIHCQVNVEMTLQKL